MLVKIDDLTPGMILGEDVILPNGMTLLNCSAKLTAHTIEQLKKYNLNEIQIAEETDSAAESSRDGDEKIDEGEKKEEIQEESVQEQNREPEETEKSEDEKETVEKDIVYTLPKITVTVENEGFSALLRIESNEGKHERFTVDNLKDILVEHDVVYGINDALLQDCVDRWEELHDIIECENVAQGVAPTPGKEGMLDIVVEYIKNARDLEKARDATYYWELINAEIPLQRVNAGDIIGKKDLQIPEIPGRNIHGDEVPSHEIIKTEVKLGDNVEEDSENSCYRSLTTGITYYMEGTLGVVPMNFDGAAELTISPDVMQAELAIHPPGEGGNPPSEESIKDLITQKNIVHGLNEKRLAKIIENVKNSIYTEKPAVVARGLPPVDGKDGQVTFLFKTETSLKPQADEHGNVNYKNVSIIQSVVKGTKIAKLHPPTKGTPGKDILGNELPCKEGTPAIMPAGPNTTVKPDNENILIAATDGNVRLNGQVVEVFEGFTIQGDVDYSTGNIEYDKSVIIGGDVKSGFSVTCGGDCEIGGTIEDAHIKAEGHVLGKLGFNGHGKGLIECHGDVNLSFIDNQTIRAHGNVTIAKEALNSTIYSRGIITVSGTNLSAAGGTLVARDGIVCHVIGNESGTHTTLEAGLDFHFKDELDIEKKKLAAIHDNRNKLFQAFERMDRLVKEKKTLSPEERHTYDKLKNSIADFDREIQITEGKITLLTKKMADIGNPFIKIEHSAMPGTLFKIGNQHYLVQKEIIGPKIIRLINEEIHIL